MRAGIVQYLNKSGGVSSLTPAQIKAIDPAGIGVDAAVLQVLDQYPAPNDHTTGDGLNTAGYRFKAGTPLPFNTYVAKLDYTVDSSAQNTAVWRRHPQHDNIGSI